MLHSNTDVLLDKAVTFLKNAGADRVAVFGSYARGEQTPESDLDILVHFKQQLSLFEFVRIEREVSEAVGIKVDLLTEKSVSPLIIDEIREEQRELR